MTDLAVVKSYREAQTSHTPLSYLPEDVKNPKFHRRTDLQLEVKVSIEKQDPTKTDL